MCGVDPVTGGLAAIKVGESIAGFIAAGDKADDQLDQYNAARARAERDAGFELAQVRLRERQEAEAIVSELMAITTQTRAAASSAEVAAAEGGAGGGASVAEVLQGFAALELQHRTRADRQIRVQGQAFNSQTESYRRDVRDQLIAAWPDPQSPGFLSLGLDIAGGALSVFNLTQD